jgi:hypothetical protein
MNLARRISSSRKNAIAVLAIIGVGAIAGLLLVRGLGRLAEQQPEPVQAEKLGGGTTLRGVRILFGAPGRVGFLAEERAVADPGRVELLAETIAREVIRGPARGVSGISPRTRVRAFYLSADGTGYLNVSSDLLAQYPRGDGLEWVSLGALVRSITENMPSVRAVQILVEGRVVERSPGAIPLDLPLTPEAFGGELMEGAG